MRSQSGFLVTWYGHRHQSFRRQTQNRAQGKRFEEAAVVQVGLRKIRNQLESMVHKTYRLQEREEEQAVLHLLAYRIRTP
jgi:hypothetical protein